MSLRNLLLAVAATGFFAAQSQAAVILYTDRPSFQAASSGLTTINFNDQVPVGTFTFYPGGSVTLSGVTFSSNVNLFAVSPSFYFEYNLGDGIVLSNQGTNPNVLTVALPPGTTALGFDFGAFGTSAFTFTLSTGDVFVLPGSDAPDTTPTFAGFTSDAPITSLTISSGDIAPQIDRFQFGQAAAPIPEPASALAFAGLLVGCGLLRRKRAAV